MKEEITPRDYPRLETKGISDIDASGATFSAEFLDRGNFEILEYGFVWSSEIRSPRVNNSESLIISGNIESKKFSSRINYVFRPGYTYYVKAFIRTESHIVYGDQRIFMR